MYCRLNLDHFLFCVRSHYVWFWKQCTFLWGHISCISFTSSPRLTTLPLLGPVSPIHIFLECSDPCSSGLYDHERGASSRPHISTVQWSRLPTDDMWVIFPSIHLQKIICDLIGLTKTSTLLNDINVGPAQLFVNSMSTRTKALAAVELLPQDQKHLHPNLELQRGQGWIPVSRGARLGTTFKTVLGGDIPATQRMQAMLWVHLNTKHQQEVFF